MRSEFGAILAMGLLMAAPHSAEAADPAPPPAEAPADSANPAVDPLFAAPYVDVDEWRDTPVRHRYVHGGFRGTDTRFSVYLPPSGQYEGRFFQYITPVPDSENLAQGDFAPEEDKIAFSIASGAYFLETNGGGNAYVGHRGATGDSSVSGYRAQAAAARYSRALAQQMYGPHRTYGYAYGGSGGAYRTLGAVENTRGVWDGSVPFVMGSAMAIPNMFTVRMHAMRILRDKFDQIVDAVDAGGSGDPYAGLTGEEAAALREVTRMGFEPRSWFGHRTMGVHAFTVLYPGMVLADPSYFEDFWTRPGYLGHDNPESFAGDRLQFRTSIAGALDADAAEAAGLGIMRIPGTARGEADTAWQVLVNDGSNRPVAYRLADTPPDVGFIGGDLIVESGENAVEEFEDRDLRSESTPDGTHFQADVASADDNEVFGDAGVGEGFCARADAVSVGSHAGNESDFAAGGEDDVFGREKEFPGLLLYGDLVGSGELAGAEKAGNPGPFEEGVDPFGESADDLLLASEHGGEIELDLVEFDSVGGEIVLGLMEEVARFEHGLAGDAADAEAGAAEDGFLFHAGGFEAVLSGFKSGDIASRPTADNHEIEIGFHLLSSVLRCLVARRIGGVPVKLPATVTI